MLKLFGWLKVAIKAHDLPMEKNQKVFLGPYSGEIKNG